MALGCPGSGGPWARGPPLRNELSAQSLLFCFVSAPHLRGESRFGEWAPGRPWQVLLEPRLRQRDAPWACGHRLVLARGVGAHTVTMSGGASAQSHLPVSSLCPAQLLNTNGAGGAGEAGGPGAGIPRPGPQAAPNPPELAAPERAQPGTGHFLAALRGPGGPPVPGGHQRLPSAADTVRALLVAGVGGDTGAFHPLVG